MGRKKNAHRAARRNTVAARDLLVEIEALEHCADEVELADKRLKEKREALKSAREATSNKGYSLKVVDVILKERKRTPEQLRLDLEAEANFQQELELYRDALAQLPEGTRSADIPLEPTPIEEAIETDLERIQREQREARAEIICSHCGRRRGDHAAPLFACPGKVGFFKAPGEPETPVPPASSASSSPAPGSTEPIEDGAAEDDPAPCPDCSAAEGAPHAAGCPQRGRDAGQAPPAAPPNSGKPVPYVPPVGKCPECLREDGTGHTEFCPRRPEGEKPCA